MFKQILKYLPNELNNIRVTTKTRPVSKRPNMKTDRVNSMLGCTKITILKTRSKNILEKLKAVYSGSRNSSEI